MPVSVEQLYGDLWREPRPGFQQQLETSLAPRGFGLMMEVFADTGAGPEHTVLDIGCRDADLSIDIANTFGCRVIGVDPIQGHLAEAQRRVANAGLSERITLKRGRIEALPLAGACLDRIWCRDVLNHVDLSAALVECRRVLRPEGQMVVFQTLATELLEPQERARLYAALAIVPANMGRERFERQAQEAGFRIVRREL